MTIRTNDAAVRAAKDCARHEAAGRLAEAQGARHRVEAALSEYGHYPEVGADAERLIDEQRGH